MKLLVKILIALAIVGVVLLGIGIRNGGELYTALQDGKLIPLQDAVERIDRGTAPIDPSQDYDYFGISVNSGSCTIKTGRHLAYSQNVESFTDDSNAIFFNVTSADAEIVLPAHKLPFLELHITDGNVQAEDLFGAKIHLFSQNGKLTAEEIEADSCKIGADTSTLYLDDLDSAQLEISSVKSDLTLDVDGDPHEYYCISETTHSTVTWDDEPLVKVDFGDTDAPRSLTLAVTESQITFDP